jgi:hypothetical protein
MRIAILLCFLIGISCVSAQRANATVQSQLSTNQTLALHWTCNFPYATATDDQGIVYSTCTGNNGSMGILWTYLDNKGQVQTGFVTSPGNGSCVQSQGLAVSHDGEYVFATCYGNPLGMQIMYYERQMNGSTWSYQPQALNQSNWACGRDIVYDNVTEDLYAICGTSLTSTLTRIIRFPHNESTDSYMSPVDLNITANYIKYNPLNNYLYFATTTNLGWLVIHNDNGTAIDMPNNMTMIPVNGTLTYYCEITSFTWMQNSSNTLFVGCTGVHDILTQYTSYSILRIDMNMTSSNMTICTNTTITPTPTPGFNGSSNTNSTNTNSTNINSTINSNCTTTNVITWTFTGMNITSTDSKAQGVDGNQDLSYPADGSCKGPSAMAVDSMNQLYVTCMQNQDARSVIRYTQKNATYYLPAYVTTPTPCSHPQPNSLTLTSQDAVIVSCYISNIVLEFTTPTTNITVTPTSSSSGIGGNGTTNGTSSSTGSSTGGTSLSSGPTPITSFTGSSSSSSSSSSISSSGSSSTGVFFPNGTLSSSSSSNVVCFNGTCTTIGSSSTGLPSSSTGFNGSNKIHVDVMVFLVSLILLVVSV